MDITAGQVQDICYSNQIESTETGIKKIISCYDCVYSMVTDDVNESLYCKMHNNYIRCTECICSKFLREGVQEIDILLE